MDALKFGCSAQSEPHRVQILVVVAIIQTRWILPFQRQCLALKTVVEKVSLSMALTQGLVGPDKLVNSV